MRFVARAAALLGAIFVSAVGHGQASQEKIDYKRHLKPGVVDPELASEPSFVVTKSGEPALIGGTVAPAGMFPASPWVGNCSATIIGERTLKTASHCVANGGSKTFQIGANRYTSTCTHHPSYARNATADWALCYTNVKVDGIPYESIATAAEVGCHQGLVFTWTGYGCQRWGGGIDGQFRYGNVSAISCPSGTNYDTITRGSVALCSGDSGGGGYTKPGEGRKVVGTNSRSNTTDTSYVSSTYTSAFRDWAKTWGDGKGTKICGVHADAPGCTSNDPEPDPDGCGDELDAADQSFTALKTCLEDLD